MRQMRSRTIALSALLFIGLGLSAGPVRAQRSIPDDNLAYPVLVEFPNELASGFYLNTGTSIYLVTARHVVLDQTGHVRTGPMLLLSYSKDPNQPGTNTFLVDMTKLSQSGEVKWSSAADVAVIHVGEVQNQANNSSAGKQANGPGSVHVASGVTVRNVVADGILSLSEENIKKYSDVLVANNVLLFGYPTSLGIKETPQLDPSRPLLRSGIVAGLNPASKTIIIDCPVYPGNSGGPVIEIDHPSPFATSFKVIGVVSEFVPFEEQSVNFPIQYQSATILNSGYTVVTPMDYVLELVN